MSERLNVKDMAVGSEQLPKRWFDPERDITPQQWEEFDGELKRLDETADFHSYVRRTADAALLGRPTPLSARQSARVEVLRAEFQRNSKWYSFIMISEAALLAGSNPEISPKDWHAIDAELEVFAANGNWDSYVRMAAAKPVLGKNVALPEHFQAGAMDSLRKYEDLHEWFMFAVVASPMTVLGIKPELSARQWQSMLRFLAACAAKVSEKDYLYFSMAARLAILSADRVEIPSEGGLKLVWDKNEQHETGSLPPEPRKF